MRQIMATVTARGEPVPGREHPHGRGVRFSQTIGLRCPGMEAARPGQFVMVRCGEDCLLPRPFSVHRTGADGELSLYYAVLEGGRGTAWLAERGIGDSVAVMGPLGKGFTVAPGSHHLLLVAGGMGIAPLLFLAEDALKHQLSVTLLYGAASKQPYPDFPPGVRLVEATEDGSAGYYGLVTDLIPEYVEGADQVFACGPLAMYRNMAPLPALQGRPVQVSLEVMMGCGFGVCYGCTIRTKRGLEQVCRDGPVFDMEDIVWDKLR